MPFTQVSWATMLSNRSITAYYPWPLQWLVVTLDILIFIAFCWITGVEEVEESVVELIELREQYLAEHCPLYIDRLLETIQEFANSALGLGLDNETKERIVASIQYLRDHHLRYIDCILDTAEDLYISAVLWALPYHSCQRTVEQAASASAVPAKRLTAAEIDRIGSKIGLERFEIGQLNDQIKRFEENILRPTSQDELDLRGRSWKVRSGEAMGRCLKRRDEAEIRLGELLMCLRQDRELREDDRGPGGVDGWADNVGRDDAAAGDDEDDGDDDDDDESGGDGAREREDGTGSEEEEETGDEEETSVDSAEEDEEGDEVNDADEESGYESDNEWTSIHSSEDDSEHESREVPGSDWACGYRDSSEDDNEQVTESDWLVVDKGSSNSQTRTESCTCATKCALPPCPWPMAISPPWIPREQHVALWMARQEAMYRDDVEMPAKNMTVKKHCSIREWRDEVGKEAPIAAGFEPYERVPRLTLDISRLDMYSGNALNGRAYSSDTCPWPSGVLKSADLDLGRLIGLPPADHFSGMCATFR